MDSVSGLLCVGTTDVVLKLGEPLCLVRMQATLDVRQMARNTKKGLKEGQRWRREKESIHSHFQLEYVQEVLVIYALDLQSNKEPK